MEGVLAAGDGEDVAEETLQGEYYRGVGGAGLFLGAELEDEAEDGIAERDAEQRGPDLFAEGKRIRDRLKDEREDGEDHREHDDVQRHEPCRFDAPRAVVRPEYLRRVEYCHYEGEQVAEVKFHPRSEAHDEQADGGDSRSRE